MTRPLFFIVLIVSASALVYAQSHGQRRPGVRQRPPVVVVTKPLNAVHPPAQVTLTSSESGYIDTSYVRMNKTALEAAASGQTPSAPPTPAPVGTASSKVRSRRVVRPVQTGIKVPISGVEDKISNHESFKALLPLDCAPKSVDFGDLVDKQAVQKAIYVTAPAAGMVSAELASGTPFHILSVKALDGKLAFATKSKWIGSLINTGPLELRDALAVARASALIKDAATQNTTASTRRRATLPTPATSMKASSLRSVSLYQTEATSAPFQVHAKEGQRIRIVVEFKPHFDLFSGDYVGVHNANLVVSADERTATVPLRAKFDGLNIGIIVVPQDRELTLLASMKFADKATGPNHVQEQHLSASTALTVANPGPPCKIYISATGLPQGFSQSSESEVLVPTGQSTQVFSVDIKFWGDDRGANYAYGYEIPFTIHTPQRFWTETLTVNLLPSMRHSHWHGGLDGVAYDIDVIAYSGGTIEMTYAFNTTNAWTTDADLRYSINGNEYARCEDIRVPTHRDVVMNPQTVSPSFLNPQLSKDWERIINSPASLWLKVSEHL